MLVICLVDHLLAVTELISRRQNANDATEMENGRKEQLVTAVNACLQEVARRMCDDQLSSPLVNIDFDKLVGWGRRCLDLLSFCRTVPEKVLDLLSGWCKITTNILANMTENVPDKASETRFDLTDYFVRHAAENLLTVSQTANILSYLFTADQILSPRYSL